MDDLDPIIRRASELRSPEERSTYLDSICGSDVNLRRRLEALLAETGAAGAGERPQDYVTAASTTSVPLDAGPGDRIGRYVLVEALGSGGCGTVFLAEQREPVLRRVALKMIKLGLDTTQMLARFDAERQAMAMMEHPNIARVLDAGATDSGRPYFVMDLVEGPDITTYCDLHELTTRQRLELFIPVCRAVQHAHQKGVIHRDIKPSNVLVATRDGAPVPIVVDFGIAKAIEQRLTERTIFTAHGQLIGTPEYMSPEQAEKDDTDVDTRADIFSLGVLLYELISGTTPFDSAQLRRAAFDEIRRIIREDEPPAPSTRLGTLGDRLAVVARRRRSDPGALTRLLRGDLDWITMKAMEKDRSRRYQSASEFAADVQRHLDDKQVTAGPPALVYLLGKFVRRHRRLVAIAAVLMLTIVAGLIASTTLYFRAEAERESAQRSRGEVARTMSSLAQALEDQDKWAEAESLLVEALKIQRDLLGNEHEQTLDTIQRLTIVMAKRGRLGVIIPLAEELVRTSRSRYGPAHVRTLDAECNLALYVRAQGRLEDAKRIAKGILQAAGADPKKHLVYIASATSILSEIHRDDDRLEEAEMLGRRALEMRRTYTDRVPEETIHSLTSLSTTLSRLGKFIEAEQLAREALEICRETLAYDHPRALSIMSNLAENIARRGRFDEGERLLREVLMIRRRRLGDGNERTALTMAKLAKLLIMKEEPSLHAEAERLLKSALDVFKINRPPRNDRYFVLSWLKNLYGPRGMNDPKKLKEIK
ncbi:MAG: hypothetical protein CMJ18_18390 [Phycisphaeraceae bacterium]|nr:hypothetical protein [Phycisphaeraceae bacterium]